MDTSTGTPSAGAAGVGMLALAPPVQAKIVYTPADVNFSRYPPVTLDLNHDGIGDFVLALGGRAEVLMSRHTHSFMLPTPAREPSRRNRQGRL
jgi:hypothetical protein